MFLINISKISENKLKKMESSISKEILNEIQLIKVKEERKRRITSAYFLKDLLSKKIGVPPANIEIMENEYGKKRCSNDVNLHFNISHSGDWVIIGFSRFEIGIDIEEMLEIDFKEVIPFFIEEEQVYLNGLNKQKKIFQFYRMWTAKESYMKYTGLGFNLDLNSFSVPFQNYGEIKLSNPHSQGGPKVASFLFDGTYYISVCSEEVENITWEYKNY
ncbi:4'-phosphopantetheinyl transferase superfamily protein [Bacillus mycoides]|uniref:4'-phosphopantetheinyl transferase family protein n=1 Tax=Bacillus mycoides TaxID=1405 RepID=UPI003D228D8B